MVIPKVKICNKIYCFLLISLGLILIIPIIDTKIIPGHDHIFHISRIEAITEALKQGVFPVRMCVDEIQFWGAPTCIFYPSLFCYIPALLKIVGIPIEICYNTFIALIVYLGLFASWNGFSLLTRSKPIGLLSTVLYISSGYYLFDAFVRNALGELIALSFMPLAIACVIHIINKTKVNIKIYPLAILSISAIIESHVLSTVFLALFVLCYSVVNYKKLSFPKLKKLSFLVLILFLLNASFIVPFLYFYKEVPISVHFINDFSDNGLNITTLTYFTIFWNFWLIVSLYIFLIHNLFGSKKVPFYKRKQLNYYARYFLLGSLFVFASSSAFPWDYLYPLKEFFKIMQFPWRFLGPASLFLSVCGGYGLHILFQKITINQNKIIVFSLLICLCQLTTFTYLTPFRIYGNWDMYEKCYWNRKPFYSDKDYLYKNMDASTLDKQSNNYITDAKITDWDKTLTNVSFAYETPTDTIITLPLVDYPGYVATNREGNILPITGNHNHMIVVPLPKGNGQITVKYKGLLSFKIADYISAIMLVLIIVYSFLCTKNRI